MSVVILVGSETGNSLDYAMRASDDFLRIGLKVEVHLMDEFDLERLFASELRVLLFICSTTGDGEEPQNMRNFMKFLRRSNLPANLFAHLSFAVFGLGDSSYEKFNFVGKRVYRRMQQLGAEDLVGWRGEGDERSGKGIEGGWTVWWEKVIECMKQKELINENSLKFADLDPLPPACTLVVDGNVERDVVKSSDHPHNRSHTIKIKLKECARVTPEDHFQDTRLLTFEAEDDLSHFVPGDILGLKPENDDESVEKCLQLLDWSGETLFYGIEGFLGNWHTAAADETIGYPMSLRDFIKKFVDLTRIPGRSVMKTLACLCDLQAAEYSRAHQEKLLELASEEGEYLEYVWRPKRNLLEIIADFQPTIKIDISRLLQVFPPIKLRQFSVANDAVMTKRIELLVALLNEELPVGRGVREGLCSRWIRKGLESGNMIRGVLSRGSINFNILVNSRIVFLFAAGTGIAPLRSIIQRLSDENVTIYLYFGCRMKSKDFYFHQEWAGYKNLTVFAAGSRDQEGGSKVYLGELIKQNSGPLLELRSLESVSFVVTGHSRLPKLVLEALQDIWAGDECKSKWVDSLKGGNSHFQTETWS